MKTEKKTSAREPREGRTPEAEARRFAARFFGYDETDDLLARLTEDGLRKAIVASRGQARIGLLDEAAQRGPAFLAYAPETIAAMPRDTLKIAIFRAGPGATFEALMAEARLRGLL